MNFRYIVLFLTFLAVHLAHSQGVGSEALADAQSFCKYITDKNKAQSVILKSPDAIARLDNGLNYNNFQKIAIAGLSKDLSEFRQAKQVDKLIEEECRFYTLNQQAQLQIQYAIPTVRSEAAKFKLQRTQIAIQKLNHLLRNTKERVNRHNETLNNYYDLNSSLIKLEDAAREIDVDLAMQHLPKIPHMNLKKLLVNLSIAQAKRQKTLNTLEKQKNWSLRVEAGAQQDLSHYYNNSVQPYFALLARYNLGSAVSNNRMNHSLDDYMLWQQKQINGTQRNLSQLIFSIASLKEAETMRLSYLRQTYQRHYGLSKELAAINSHKATHFKQKLEVDRISMEIEINYLERTIALLNSII